MPFLYELMIALSEPSYTVVQHLVPAGTLVGTGQAVLYADGWDDGVSSAGSEAGLLVAWFAEHGAVMEHRGSDGADCL